MKSIKEEANLVNKKWAVNFDQEMFMGKKMSYDLICAKTGNIVIKEGQKLNKKALANLQDINFSDYELTDDVISGYVVVEDVIVKGPRGELACELFE